MISKKGSFDLKEPFLGYLRIVKNTLKVLILIPAVFLYCLVSGHFRNNALVHENVIAQVSNEKNHSSVGKVFLSYHSALPATTLRSFHSLLFSQKNKLSPGWNFAKLLESLLLNRNSKYQDFAENSIEWFGPTDIIFPSHFFW